MPASPPNSNQHSNQHSNSSASHARQPNGQTLFLAGVIVVSFLLVGYLVFFYGKTDPREDEVSAAVPKQFESRRAFGYLKAVCDLGPRISGSAGMKKQQELLTRHFEKLGGKVRMQEFRARDPRDGEDVKMANLIVEWNPEAKERILLCAHYDTRPYPDRDPRNPRGTFIGANDGGSGVAALMEMGHHIAKIDGEVGVDFCFFDGEELVVRDENPTLRIPGDPYFLGSRHFAQDYVDNPPGFRYRWAVLLDMIGDKNLRIMYEPLSISWPDSRPLVEDIWKVARSLGVREFVARKGETPVRDDHVMLHDVGKISACDIIDFEYPHWHTEADTPDKCSGESLVKVVWVVHEWLKREVRK